MLFVAIAAPVTNATGNGQSVRHPSVRGPVYRLPKLRTRYGRNPRPLQLGPIRPHRSQHTLAAM